VTSVDRCLILVPATPGRSQKGTSRKPVESAVWRNFRKLRAHRVAVRLQSGVVHRYGTSRAAIRGRWSAKRPRVPHACRSARRWERRCRSGCVCEAVRKAFSSYAPSPAADDTSLSRRVMHRWVPVVKQGRGLRCSLCSTRALRSPRERSRSGICPSHTGQRAATVMSGLVFRDVTERAAA